jgi:rubrerythrin
MTDEKSTIEEKETTSSTRKVAQPEARKTAPSRTADDVKKSKEKRSGEDKPKGDPNCTHCFGTGVIMHGGEMPCPWCTEEGKKFAHLKGSE